MPSKRGDKPFTGPPQAAARPPTKGGIGEGIGEGLWRGPDSSCSVLQFRALWEQLDQRQLPVVLIAAGALPRALEIPPSLR